MIPENHSLCGVWRIGGHGPSRINGTPVALAEVSARCTRPAVDMLIFLNPNITPLPICHICLRDQWDQGALELR